MTRQWYAACWIDSTRNVVKSVHRSREAAEKAVARLVVGQTMPWLVATVVKLDRRPRIGERLYR